MTIIVSFAGFFLKKSTFNLSIISIIKNKYLYIGGFLYIISTCFNIWLLQKLSYSIVVSLGSLCYIWTIFIAYFFLKEKITFSKIIGILLIISGVLCIAI